MFQLCHRFQSVCRLGSRETRRLQSVPNHFTNVGIVIHYEDGWAFIIHTFSVDLSSGQRKTLLKVVGPNSGLRKGFPKSPLICGEPVCTRFAQLLPKISR